MTLFDLTQFDMRVEDAQRLAAAEGLSLMRADTVIGFKHVHRNADKRNPFKAQIRKDGTFIGVGDREDGGPQSGTGGGKGGAGGGEGRGAGEACSGGEGCGEQGGAPSPSFLGEAGRGAGAPRRDEGAGGA